MKRILLGLALIATLGLAVTGCRVWLDHSAGWEFNPHGLRTNTPPEAPTP